MNINFCRCLAWNIESNKKEGERQESSKDATFSGFGINFEENSVSSSGNYKIKEQSSKGCADEGAAELAEKFFNSF